MGRLVSWNSLEHRLSFQLPSLRTVPLVGQSVSIPDLPDLSAVPEEYYNLGEQHTLFLPPHCPYNCSMDLLPGAPLPSSCLYNLSCLEQEAMERFFGESLASGLIRPSSSPVGAGSCLFKRKMDLFDPASTTGHLIKTTGITGDPTVHVYFKLL